MEYNEKDVRKYIGILYVCKYYEECEIHLFNLRENSPGDKLIWMLMTLMYEE